MRGSWAGAFGPTQFMPTAFKRYAVDGDNDGRRDVVDNAADLIASTANNLKKDGWQSGQAWGYEVVVPQGFNYLHADRSRQLTLTDRPVISAGGVRTASTPRASTTSRSGTTCARWWSASSPTAPWPCRSARPGPASSRDRR